MSRAVPNDALDDRLELGIAEVPKPRAFDRYPQGFEIQAEPPQKALAARDSVWASRHRSEGRSQREGKVAWVDRQTTMPAISGQLDDIRQPERRPSSPSFPIKRESFDVAYWRRRVGAVCRGGFPKQSQSGF
ncbi:hypothetical protein [Methylobacterium tardum]|uniref:hypothetical protein n=1 Tax=Methylobacterium tardum TaxID=374432 RepID=UPI001EDD15B7|nr:hypothetical protein [Methylobacterium tardum]URD38336.1 hypothetical protein M6G65_07795 [Methylobacterium tardum]